MPYEHHENWRKRLIIVQARGKGEAKFRPVLYLDNEMQFDTNKLFDLISHELTQAQLEILEKVEEIPYIRDMHVARYRQEVLSSLRSSITNKNK